MPPRALGGTPQPRESFPHRLSATGANRKPSPCRDHTAGSWVKSLSHASVLSPGAKRLIASRRAHSSALRPLRKRLSSVLLLIPVTPELRTQSPSPVSLHGGDTHMRDWHRPCNNPPGSSFFSNSVRVALMHVLCQAREAAGCSQDGTP